MPKVKRFKNPLKVANGRASSSTTPAAQALPDASTIPSQAHEEQTPILLQEEQASITPQQEQAPILPQQEQVHVLPCNSSVPHMNQRIYSKYWNVDARDSENAIKQINVKDNERWSGPLGMPKKYMENCYETILKPRFLFEVRESIAYRYCNASISKKWATHRQRLWNEYFDSAKS
ncbi:hypothetical protein KY285_010588 [Solanum tuberosum]|nr:hypothetical protein KY289_011132 [Solanum tuberosum]KAH0734881.1 hypothetical protein KY285_010588 [Solanum tuberosum]